MSRMVRAGGSPPMLVVGEEDGIKHCVFVDGGGVIRHRFVPGSALTPLWLSFSPKTAWPDTGHADLIAIEKEERLAAEARRATRRAARKAKRSNRIKERRSVAA